MITLILILISVLVFILFLHSIKCKKYKVNMTIGFLLIIIAISIIPVFNLVIFSMVCLELDEFNDTYVFNRIKKLLDRKIW